MRAMIRSLTVICLCAGLVACAESSTSPTLPSLTFAHQPLIRLAVDRIDLVNEYRMPLKAPNVEHALPVAPGPAVERWSVDILRAVGGPGRAVLVILNGAVTETKLKKQTGLKGTFTVDQSEKYDAVVEARLEILDDANKRLAEISATVQRSRTVSEDSSPNQRTRLQYELVEALMNDYDTAMRDRAARYLSKWLR